MKTGSLITAAWVAGTAYAGVYHARGIAPPPSSMDKHTMGGPLPTSSSMPPDMGGPVPPGSTMPTDMGGPLPTSGTMPPDMGLYSSSAMDLMPPHPPPTDKPVGTQTMTHNPTATPHHKPPKPPVINCKHDPNVDKTTNGNHNGGMNDPKCKCKKDFKLVGEGNWSVCLFPSNNVKVLTGGVRACELSTKYLKAHGMLSGDGVFSSFWMCTKNAWRWKPTKPPKHTMTTHLVVPTLQPARTLVTGPIMSTTMTGDAMQTSAMGGGMGGGMMSSAKPPMPSKSSAIPPNAMPSHGMPSNGVGPGI